MILYKKKKKNLFNLLYPYVTLMFVPLDLKTVFNEDFGKIQKSASNFQTQGINISFIFYLQNI